jgi:hypothetical protein
MPSVPGVSVDDAGIAVRNAVVDFRTGGYDAGATAPVSLSIFNDTDSQVRLVEASSEDAGSVVLAGGDSSLAVPPGDFVATTLRVRALREPLDGTGSVPLVLGFNNGVTLSMTVPMAPPANRVGQREPMTFDEEH